MKNVWFIYCKWSRPNYFRKWVGQDITKFTWSTETVNGNWNYFFFSKGKSLGCKPVQLQVICYHDSGDCKGYIIPGSNDPTSSPYNAKTTQRRLGKVKPDCFKRVSDTNLSPHKLNMLPVSFISNEKDQIIYNWNFWKCNFDFLANLTILQILDFLKAYTILLQIINWMCEKKNIVFSFCQPYTLFWFFMFVYNSEQYISYMFFYITHN